LFILGYYPCIEVKGLRKTEKPQDMTATWLRVLPQYQPVYYLNMNTVHILSKGRLESRMLFAFTVD
jgi:hypothetical protein